MKNRKLRYLIILILTTICTLFVKSCWGDKNKIQLAGATFADLLVTIGLNAIPIQNTSPQTIEGP